MTVPLANYLVLVVQFSTSLSDFLHTSVLGGGTLQAVAPVTSSACVCLLCASLLGWPMGRRWIMHVLVSTVCA